MVERVRQHQYPGNLQPEDLVIPPALTTTIGDQQQSFLINDNGNNNQRIMTSCSPAFMQLLSQATDWFVDGNFSMAPRHFLQLYIIRIPLSESCIMHHARDSYTELLQTIVDNCVNGGRNHLNPARVHCDFEMAMHQGIREVFPNTQVTACFYHLTQSTWRKIQELGLVARYRDDDEIRAFVGMLDGLAFVPVDNMNAALAIIRDATPNEFQDLVDYFDVNYVTGLWAAQLGQQGAGLQMILQRPPLYPPATWNMYEVTLANGHQTNNNCESWNMRVKTLVGQDHPTVWKLGGEGAD